MQCDYFDADRCRSCTLMGVPYPRQLADKQAAAGAVLPAATWLEPFASRESGFRNKAKLVVGGRRGAPTLGILDAHGNGIDLSGCGLYEPGLAAVLPHVHDLVAGAGIAPYDVPRRRGELKNVIVTHSATGASMVRFVLRSEAEVDVLRHNLGRFQANAAGVVVVTANLQPEHKAVLEGPDEIVLTRQSELRMPVGDLTVRLRPQSFFQTNTAVAAGLYEQAVEWSAGATRAWDLYCGVGGFALHLARAGIPVTGVETSSDAVASARDSARDARLDARFVAADATEYAAQHTAPDLVVVNPPRRGLGRPLAEALDRCNAERIVYSSCHPTSLATDLGAMPSYRVTRARLFDMFPQTEHAEVMVLLERR